MAVTAENLRTEVGANPAADLAPFTSAVNVADTLLRKYVGDEYVNIPLGVYEAAWLAVAVDLYNQRQAPNGVLNQQFATPDGSVTAPVRISADPLRPARPLLEQYVIAVGFA